MQNCFITCPKPSLFYIPNEKIREISLALVLYRDRTENISTVPHTYTNAKAQHFLRKNLSALWQQLHNFHRNYQDFQKSYDCANIVIKQNYSRYLSLVKSRAAIREDSPEASFLPIEKKLRPVLRDLRQIQSESSSLVITTKLFVQDVSKYLEAFRPLTDHLADQSHIKACTDRCDLLFDQAQTLQSHPIQNCDFSESINSLGNLLHAEAREEEEQRKYDEEHFMPIPTFYRPWS